MLDGAEKYIDLPGSGMKSRSDLKFHLWLGSNSAFLEGSWKLWSYGVLVHTFLLEPVLRANFEQKFRRVKKFKNKNSKIQNLHWKLPNI